MSIRVEILLYMVMTLVGVGVMLASSMVRAGELISGVDEHLVKTHAQVKHKDIVIPKVSENVNKAPEQGDEQFKINENESPRPRDR